MARPIRIPFVSDVREFLKGTRDVEAGLDDVADSLDDLSREAAGSGQEAGQELADGFQRSASDIIREAERAGEEAGQALAQGLREGRPADELADEFRAAARRVEADVQAAAAEVESSTEKMERSFRDAFDGARKESSDAGRDVGRNVDDGFDRAKAGAEDFRDEANDTAREAAASFDGSAASIGDAFQEVAANAFVGFGAAGAAAGLAAAAGLGFVFSAMEKAKEEAQDVRDHIGEITGELNDVRLEGADSLEVIADRMRQMSEASEETATKLQDLRDLAEGITEIDFESVVRGLSGDPEALERTIDAIERELEVLEGQEDLSLREGAIHADRVERAEELLGLLTDERSARREAQEEHQLLIDAGIEDIARDIEARRARKDAANAFLEEEAAAAESFRETWATSVSDAYAEAGGAIEQFVEDGKFNLDDYMAHANAQAEALRAYQQNLVESSSYLSEQAMQYVLSLGPRAAPALAAFVEAPASKKQQLAEIWNSLGLTSSDSYVTGLEQNMPGTIPGPKIVPQVDDGPVQAWKRRIGDQVVWIDVRARGMNQIA